MKKYEELIQNLKRDISSKKYKAGSRLPSIREMTKMFGCSKATAIKAYEELEKQHIIYSKPQSGYFLVEIPDSLGNSAYKADFGSEAIDFTSASPSPEVLPYMDFQHCLNQAIELYKDLLFSYSDPQGLTSTRKVLSEYLKDYQIFTRPDNIFVTTGSQQILSILAAMPFPNGKTCVAVEQPVYNGIIKALEHAGVTAIGIERGFDGIDLAQLEKIFRTNSIKFFYTIPRFHNPTGGSYSLSQKKEIVRLAEKYDVYILEDDYLGDLDINLKNDPMFSFDTGERTIYAKSFSKVLLPGLRLGAAVLPKLLVNKFKEYKRAADISTSILSQGALEIYIKSGMFNSHITSIKGFYRNRMEHFRKTIDVINPTNISYKVPETGFFTSLELPDGFYAERLVQRLKSKNISVINARILYMDSFMRENQIRLSICRTDEAKITRGLRTLCSESHSMFDVHKNKPSDSSEPENVYTI